MATKYATFGEALAAPPPTPPPSKAPSKAPAESPLDHPCMDANGDGMCDKCGAPCEDHPAAPAVPPKGATSAEVPFVGVALVLDYETGDGRLISSTDFTWRPTPLPLMYQDTNPAESDHTGAYLIGRIEDIVVDGRRVWMRGMIDPNASDRSEQIVEMLRSQTARFVSVDLAGADVEYDVRTVDEEGWPMDVLSRFNGAVMAGATITPFPAIPDAVIWLDGETAPPEAYADLPDAPPLTAEPQIVPGDGMPMLLMAAVTAPTLPPSSWFADPELSAPTPLTITDDGRVFGHLALWGVCHVGHQGCVTAPTSPSEYRYFATGATRVHCDCEEPDCDDVVEIPTGVLTLGTLHAGLAMDGPHALAHYEDTGCAACDLVAGEDSHGIWIAGALRPTLAPEQIAELRGSSPSGDWRRIGGALELVAALAVNVPGFPVPRTAARLVAAAGIQVQTALVAPADPRLDALTAGGRRTNMARTVTIDRDTWSSVLARLARLEAIAMPLKSHAAEAIAASIER